MPSTKDLLKPVYDFYNGDEFPANVLIDKYLLRDSDGNFLETSVEQLIDRVAHGLADNTENPNKWFPIFVEAIANLKGVVPQGSVLSGIGQTESFQSLSNCFAVPSPEDSISGIFKTSEQMAQIFKRRGGCGVSLSTLRPEFAPVSNAAKTSSGVPGWMDFFSNTGRAVGTKGRRSAIMLSMAVNHPDVFSFATIKNDKTKVTGANISLELSDNFMEAVVNNAPFELQWPVDSKTPQITKTIDANELWSTICESAHQSAEPGLLFWGNIQKNLPADFYDEFKTITTNPSLRKGTRILTDGGIFEIDQLEGKTFNIRGFNGEWAEGKCFLSGQSKQLYRILISGKHEIYCTAEHKWPIYSQTSPNNMAKVETKDLVSGHLLFSGSLVDRLFDGSIGTFDEGFLIGCVAGDGWMTTRSDNGKLQIGLSISNKKIALRDEIQRILSEKFNCHGKFTDRKSTFEINIMNQVLIDKFTEYGIKTKTNGLPDILFNGASEDFRVGVLTGLFATDGYFDVEAKKRISLTTAYEKMATDVCDMLGYYGIKTCKLYSQQKGNFPNGKTYDGKLYDKWSIQISDKVSIAHFVKIFDQIKKYRPIMDMTGTDMSMGYSRKFAKVVSVEKTELFEDVWDITVNDDYHCFQLPQVYTGNCSEIPLSKFDSCRLTSICLTSYVNNKFQTDAYFDWSQFEKDVRTAMRMMDALVTAEIKSVERILDKVKQDNIPNLVEIELWENILNAGIRGRRCGLGVHGLADALCQLTVVYDSDAGVKWVEDIFSNLCYFAYDESIEMAKDFGPFPIFDWEKEKDCNFFKHFPVELIEKMKKHGRRNISILTCAPTGSISILSGCSTGIEPTFRNSYTRKRKINANDISARVDFIDDVGDKWQNYLVVERNVQLYFASIGEDLPGSEDELIQKLPKYFRTSDQIDWQKRVILQGALTKYIDHSVSSTVNIPESATVDDVKQIYETAWKAGCKGVTVYRENSRSGVLVSNDKKVDTTVRPDKLTRIDSPIRPKVLPCQVHFTSVKGKEFVVIVGFLGESVYEVFAGEHNNTLPNKQFSGEIIKQKSGQYDLCYVENGEEKKININRYFDNTEFEGITRLVSTSLRHHTPLAFVVEQLTKSSFDFGGFEKSLARVLRKYAKKEDLIRNLREDVNDDIEIQYVDGCTKIINHTKNTVISKCE